MSNEAMARTTPYAAWRRSDPKPSVESMVSATAVAHWPVVDHLRTVGRDYHVGDFHGLLASEVRPLDHHHDAVRTNAEQLRLLARRWAGPDLFVPGVDLDADGGHRVRDAETGVRADLRKCDQPALGDACCRRPCRRRGPAHGLRGRSTQPTTVVELTTSHSLFCRLRKRSPRSSLPVPAVPATRWTCTPSIRFWAVHNRSTHDCALRSLAATVGTTCVRVTKCSVPRQR